MLVICCGSRGWDDPQTIRSALAELSPQDLILTTDSLGADQAIAEIAEENDTPVEVNKIAWSTLGRRAGHICLVQMLQRQPDQVWLFWDGESKGTQSTMQLAAESPATLRVWQP
jgi:hypothetical protein